MKLSFPTITLMLLGECRLTHTRVGIIASTLREEQLPGKSSQYSMSPSFHPECVCLLNLAREMKCNEIHAIVLQRFNKNIVC